MRIRTIVRAVGKLLKALIYSQANQQPRKGRRIRRVRLLTVPTENIKRYLQFNYIVKRHKLINDAACNFPSHNNPMRESPTYSENAILKNLKTSARK